MRKITKPMAVCTAVLMVLSLSACAVTGTSAEKTIQVSSTEEVKVVPDIAEISFAVSTQGTDPKTTQQQNSTDVDKVISFLKESGLDEKSIQTSNYGLEPIYDWNAGQTITGYQMHTGIVVSDVPIDSAGTLISSSIEAGINNIDQVSYLSSKYDESYQEALTKAIASAKEKAQAIASSSGYTIEGLSNVVENSTYNNSRYTSYTASGSGSVADEKAMVIEPGQINVEADVTVTYTIK